MIKCPPVFAFLCLSWVLTRGWASEVLPGSAASLEEAPWAPRLSPVQSLSPVLILSIGWFFFSFFPFLFICLTIAPLSLRTLVTSEYLYLHHHTYAKFQPFQYAVTAIDMKFRFLLSIHGLLSYVKPVLSIFIKYSFGQVGCRLVPTEIGGEAKQLAN